MGGRFCFFTDPALLGAQTAAQVFGPQPAVGGMDRFQCADIHGAAAGAPAVAVCDGQLRAQWNATGTSLTLILKPDNQPAFDFPFVSYYLYKEVDPASLLLNGEILTKTAAPDLELIDRLQDTWLANGNVGAADESALGLDLKASAGVNYADDQPIDRLFYNYSPEKPPVPVAAGLRIGRFKSQFGFLILVERIGRPPPLARAREAQTLVEAPPLGSAPANDARDFLARHDKREEILGYVDPCAFWGSFFRLGLSASKAAGRVDAANIYTAILCGSGGEGGAAFGNRHRAYVDIRNEHGQSLDYYRTPSVGPMIGVGFEDQSPPAVVDYYQSGWPCWWIGGVALPTLPTTADQLQVRLALPATDFARPLTYVSTGSIIPATGGAKLRPFREQERFFDRPPGADPFYLEPAKIAVPLVPGNPPVFLASYQKVHHFKRPIINSAATPPALAGDPDNLAPVSLGPLHHLLPMTDAPAIPANGKPTAVRTYAEELLVPWPTDTASAFVARPGIAQDAANIYLFLFPSARQSSSTSKKDLGTGLGPPSLRFAGNFFADFLATELGSEFKAVTLSLSGAASVQIVRGSARDSEVIVVVLNRAAYESALLAPDGSTSVLQGTGFLSLTPGEPIANFSGRKHIEAVASYSRLLAPTSPGPNDKVERDSQQPFPTFYADADL